VAASQFIQPKWKLFGHLDLWIALS